MLSNETLEQRIKILKSSGASIVFTNGCFDILHSGHVEYLEAAKQLGDILIVGINDDDSVRRLKGINRPVNKLQDRLIIISALQSVDYVMSFSEDTPDNLIHKIVPDILVKGGDYKKEHIIGAGYVEGYGGEVIILPFKAGYSSTEIIKRALE